ncbi:hypothetical protein [Seonamhaeicola sp.]|uniref:TolB family protein n=1 Tax=Seonamhaeicola sp. TaxID=1912245 RepID=UPI00261918EE|nr:hypothetical protein [Seonamhaeicola sp.]
MKHFCCLLIFLSTFLTVSQTDAYKVVNVELNSEHPHFGLMPIGENKILFTSYLLDKKERPKKKQGVPVLTVFQAAISSEGHITNEVPVQIDPKQNIVNITSATISPNGKNLFITTRYSYKNKPQGNFNMDNFHIEIGEYKAGVGWTNFKVLPFCKLKYSYAHPALSKDGKILYFTANVRGGRETTRGGSDIFKVDVLGNNTYGEPKNLGSKVNSYSREMFPVIANDNTLYFASNRPGGFGGYDVYKSVMDEHGVFTKAEKLPKPLNSNKDDFSLITNDNGASGYLSSKRLKGKGDDDIYYFKKK